MFGAGCFLSGMKLWFYVLPNGDRVGPVEDVKFMELARSGVITADTLVWNEGMTEWKKWAVVRPPEMADVVVEAVAQTQDACEVEAAGQGSQPGQAAADAAPAGQVAALVAPIEFRGKWEEYFKIWIVNVLLTVATLGIYAAWAKVRTRRYFYGNTRLFGHAFEYLANPRRILAGNLIVAAMFFIYTFSEIISPLAKLALLLVFVPLVPWLVVRGLVFNARNSAWRGLRFRFGGSYWDAFKLFVLWPVAIVCSFGLLLPYVEKRKKEFYINNHAYGKTGFSMRADTGFFYRLYLKALLFFAPLILGYFGLIAVVAAGTVRPGGQMDGGAAMMAGLMMIFIYGGLLCSWVGANYLKARLFTYVWNNSQLGEHRFRARMRARDLLLVKFVNNLITSVTLGLLYPFARVRLVEFQLSCLQVEKRGDLDAFVAESEPEVGALGDSASDFWDFDIGFGI